MRRAEKEKLVEELGEALGEHRNLVLVDYRGLSVKAIVELRRTIRDAGGRMRVVKNRLFARALREGDQAELKQFLTGPVAVVFAGERPVALLKAMTAFARAHEQLALRGGLVDDEVLDGEQLAELAALPPRDELLARLMGSLSAPLMQLVSVLEAIPRELVLTLRSLVQQREEEAAEPAGA